MGETTVLLVGAKEKISTWILTTLIYSWLIQLRWPLYTNSQYRPFEFGVSEEKILGNDLHRLKLISNFLFRDFAYVAKEKDNAVRIYKCHVFRCDNTSARTIANTLRDICRNLMMERGLLSKTTEIVDDEHLSVVQQNPVPKNEILGREMLFFLAVFLSIEFLEFSFISNTHGRATRGSSMYLSRLCLCRKTFRNWSPSCCNRESFEYSSRREMACRSCSYFSDFDFDHNC